MVYNRKVSMFLGGIVFGTMDSGKATVLADSQISNSFALTNDYLTHFVHNKKKINFREIYYE